MIANPGVPAFRYDPYVRVLTREGYDQGGMRRVRRQMVERARGAKTWVRVQRAATQESVSCIQLAGECPLGWPQGGNVTG